MVSQNLELHYLPPYSPELNPDEAVWNELKNNGIGCMQVVGPEDMKRKAHCCNSHFLASE